MKKTLLIVVLGLSGLAIGGYFGIEKFDRSPDIPKPGTLAAIALPDVEKKVRNGGEWLGKVVVVNHWATWCAPCRQEIPMLLEYQDRMFEQGVQIIGIAHDLLEPTRIFGDEIGITYPSLLAIVGGNELLNSHGNENQGALPFTAVFDRNGNLAAKKLGMLSLTELDDMVRPLL